MGWIPKPRWDFFFFFFFFNLPLSLWVAGHHLGDIIFATLLTFFQFGWFRNFSEISLLALSVLLFLFECMDGWMDGMECASCT
ncbi:hypothetical protein DM02DRAFT_23332 [Periconia macrospinosa]|uniref:Uncharacterized protein n=1 Tax=Periconia macrospinosa TaxID=97972 RepID=A0A2V1DM61_9PLEO|nr:hypothetical protein DM02DRAFT_23332 [Periconia macrospinosa]